MTTRRGGASRGPYATLNLSGAVGDDPIDVAENWRRLRAAAGIEHVPLARCRQVHGAAVWRVEGAPGSKPEADPSVGPPADAMVTRLPDVCLALLVADCVPVFAADPTSGVIGLAHAGWRGTASGVTGAMLAAMLELGATPDHTRVALGPSIGREDYEVGPEVADALRAAFPDMAEGWITAGPRSRPHVDLWAANADQAHRMGVPRERISVVGISTASSDRFYSYRRDGMTGRFAAGIRRLGA